MKKALIKLVIQLIFLAILASVVFAIGYVQFAIPFGKYAVMVSKTSGYHDEIISHDGVTWRWERLIPTNSRLLFFDLSPITMEEHVVGELENGKRYATVLRNESDFSWKVSANCVFYKNMEEIILELKKTNIQTEKELNLHLQKKAKEAIVSAIESAVFFYQEGSEKYTANSFKEKCRELCQKSLPNSLKLESFSLKIEMPEFSTYKLAKETYLSYAQEKKDFISERIEKLKELQMTLQELSVSVEKSISDLSDVR